MPWDIYGQPLSTGHCEVHPLIPQPHPCEVCREDADREEERAQRAWEEEQERQRQADWEAEREYRALADEKYGEPWW